MFDAILTNPSAVVGILFVLALVVFVVYAVFGGAACPTELHRRADGSLELRPTGQLFDDMNAFQQWWHKHNPGCPLPLLTGAREVPVMAGPSGAEQTYAKTPINKVDDYEFSRIYGYERDGHMILPRENYNRILEERTFDWADRPMTSDERRDKYQGLKEGFTAHGDLSRGYSSGRSHEGFTTSGDLTREAAARYGEKGGDEDIECKMSRESREVAKMVARAYESDPAWEPVVTKVGPHHWEVNELKPRRRYGDIEEVQNSEESVVDTRNDAVDVRFKFREQPVIDDAIDPYFGGIPFTSERRADPFMGPVPGMERMFGPTFDHKKWY